MKAKKPNGKAEPKAPTLNRSGLAREYGVAPQTVDSWVRRGCPHRRRSDGTYVFKLPAVAKWRARKLAEDSQRAKGPSHRVIPEAAREWLDAMWIAQDHMLPWLVDRVEPGPDTAHVVGVEEYKRGEHIDGDELLYRLAFGLPTLPPSPGETKGARISLPHAKAWLLMFSGFIESIGGDGFAKRIAHEGLRLRGFPVPPGDADAGGDAEGGEASP